MFIFIHFRYEFLHVKMVHVYFAPFQVRVPTHEDGSCLFWEFSTDYYDIGFGVYFEWTVEPNNTVTVHVSESSDEEDLEEEQQGNNRYRMTTVM
jgi:hypothetical protein